MKAIILLLALAAALYAADRVVLLEDFTNSGCGPCWSIEPTLNAFVNSHLAAGDLSVARIHVNWPSASDPIYLANPTEQNARRVFYGVTSVPTLKMDGVVTASAYTLENAHTNRMNVPCYLDISVSKHEDRDSGTLYVTLTAEQSLGTENLRLHAILVEDRVPGVGYWAGSYFEQAFRDNLCGAHGQVVVFTEPFPSTVEVELPYDTHSWKPEELNLCLFLQGQSSKEVFNAYYSALEDIPAWTGIEDEGPSGLSVSVFPNPSTGSFTVQVPYGSHTGLRAEVYDIGGRLVTETDLSMETTSFNVASTGIYLLRVSGDSGMSTVKRIVVAR